MERCFGVLLLQKQKITRFLLAIVNEDFFNRQEERGHSARSAAAHFISPTYQRRAVRC
jgi:hypothetical protein